jgi:hypothetical protein
VRANPTGRALTVLALSCSGEESLLLGRRTSNVARMCGVVLHVADRLSVVPSVLRSNG